MDPFQVVLHPSQIGDLADVSPFLRSSWDAVRASHMKAAHYYSGEIFTKKVETETGEDGAPLLYPIGINLVKMMVLSMTDATYGEWDDVRNVLVFKSKSNTAPTEAEKAAVEYATGLMEDSNAPSMLWEAEFDRNLYGAAVLRIMPDLPRASHVRWYKVPLDGFYPVFDPADPDKIVECWQVTQILAEQAKAIYGIETSSTTPLVKVEHWSTSIYETKVDGKVVSAYSGTNPWGVVPYVYIPRMRTIDWWGESLVEDIYGPQDEMNMRLADAGEALNYHSHPVYWGRNLPNNFNSDNYPLDPSALWDLGRARGGENPEVGMLKNDTPVSEGLYKYVQFLYDWTRTSASDPPIAFGDDNGGGQRSGDTLEIRLWPMIKAIRRSRGYLSTGITEALRITGKILAQKKFSDIPAGVASELLGRRVVPVFNSVLPRDEAKIVDEVTKLLSTNPPSISLESAQVLLGRGIGEVAKIEKMMPDIEKWAPIAKALEAVHTVQTGTQPKDGSGATPQTNKVAPDPKKTAEA